MVDREMNLVGIIAAGSTDGAGRGYAVPVQRLVDLLGTLKEFRIISIVNNINDDLAFEYRWKPDSEWAQENLLSGYYWQSRRLEADTKQFEIRYNKISPCALKSGTDIFDSLLHIQQTDGPRYEFKRSSRDPSLILTSEGSSQPLCQ